MKRDKKYLIKVDGELYYEEDSLRTARRVAEALAKRIEIENLPQKVTIEKHTTTIEIVNIYEQKQIIVNARF